jgi:hypothetical protein
MQHSLLTFDFPLKNNGLSIVIQYLAFRAFESKMPIVAPSPFLV